MMNKLTADNTEQWTQAYMGRGEEQLLTAPFLSDCTQTMDSGEAPEGLPPVVSPWAAAGVRYRVLCSFAEDEAGNRYTVYGLECLLRQGDMWVLADAVTDVSMCVDAMRDLAERCNTSSLSPLHFRDVVLDTVNCPDEG